MGRFNSEKCTNKVNYTLAGDPWCRGSCRIEEKMAFCERRSFGRSTSWQPECRSGQDKEGKTVIIYGTETRQMPAQLALPHIVSAAEELAALSRPAQ
jgi:hypothetical protein